MTDEDAFHARMDENPACMVTKLAFADWLEEHGRGEEAAGWRAMAELGIYAQRIGYSWTLGS